MVSKVFPLYAVPQEPSQQSLGSPVRQFVYPSLATLSWVENSWFLSGPPDHTHDSSEALLRTASPPELSVPPNQAAIGLLEVSLILVKT